METVTEKNVITTEELQSLQSHLNESQSLTLEFGEIEIIKLQLETRYENTNISKKYGDISLDYKTGEYTKLG